MLHFASFFADVLTFHSIVPIPSFHFSYFLPKTHLAAFLFVAFSTSIPTFFAAFVSPIGCCLLFFFLSSWEQIASSHSITHWRSCTWPVNWAVKGLDGSKRGQREKGKGLMRERWGYFALCKAARGQVSISLPCALETSRGGEQAGNGRTTVFDELCWIWFAELVSSSSSSVSFRKLSLVPKRSWINCRFVVISAFV